MLKGMENMSKPNVDSIEIRALEVLIKEYSSVVMKLEKRRSTEIDKIKSKNEELENTTYNDLQEAYAVGNITEGSFDKKRKELEEYQKSKDGIGDQATPITEAIKYAKVMLKRVYNELNIARQDEKVRT